MAMTRSVRKRLLEILETLPPEQAQALLDYAEFLCERYAVAPGITEPLPIERPPEESVVRAIKRLRTTYPMLDPAKLLNETSMLVSQHVTQGRGAVEVIDELEVLFRSHYERLLDDDKG
jgi:hypothetical protein